MLENLQRVPALVWYLLPTLAECKKTVNNCKTNLVNLTDAHYGKINTENNRKIVCMNAFVSFGLSVIAGSTVPVAVSAAALAVVASAVYAVATPLFKDLFADEHGKMSRLEHAFCETACVALTLSLAPEQGLSYLISGIRMLYIAIRGRKDDIDVHQMPRIFLF